MFNCINESPKKMGLGVQNGLEWVTHEKKSCVGRDEELKSHRFIMNLSVIMIPHH